MSVFLMSDNNNYFSSSDLNEDFAEESEGSNPMLEVIKEMVNLRILRQTPFLLIALRYFVLIMRMCILGNGIGRNLSFKVFIKM